MRSLLTGLLVFCIGVYTLSLVYDPYPGRFSEESNEPDIIKSRDWGYDEGEAFAQLAEYEAGDNSLVVKELVILVALNRLWCKGFGDTVDEVVGKMTDGRYKDIEPSEEAYEAVYHVQVDYLDDMSCGALYYAKNGATKLRYGLYRTELFSRENFTFYK